MKDFLEKVGAFDVIGIPVGATALFLVTMGIGGGVMNVARRFKVPPALSGGLLSFLATRGFAEKGMGLAPSHIAGTALLLEAADLQTGALDWVVAMTERIPLGLPATGQDLLAEELGYDDALAGYDAGALGEGEAVYLTDVERKVQATMRAQM